MTFEESETVRGLGFDLASLEIFLIVCRTGGMTAAATQLGLTQPAVSRAITQLEDRLGTVLFQRSKRPLRPTGPGRRLQERARHLVEDALGLPRAIRAGGRESLHRLRLGVLDSLADPFVPQAVGGLRGTADSVAVLTGVDGILRQGLLDHELDAVVSTDPLDDLSGFERFPLFRESFICIAPRGERPFVDEAGFRAYAAAHPMIRFGPASSIGRSVEQHLRRLRVGAPERFTCSTIESVMGLIASGMGWSVATPVCLRKCLHLGPALQVLPFPGPGLARTVFLVTRAGELSPHDRRIAEILRGVIRRAYLPELVPLAPWMKEALCVVS